MQAAVRLQSWKAQVILNHFRLIPLKAKERSSITVSEWLQTTRDDQAVGKDWKRQRVFVTCLSHTHYPQFHLSATRKNTHVVSHINWSLASHCCRNLTQQEATGATITCLSTLSVTVTHTRKKALTVIFLLTIHPSLFFPPLRQEMISLHYR